MNEGTNAADGTEATKHLESVFAYVQFYLKRSKGPKDTLFLMLLRDKTGAIFGTILLPSYRVRRSAVADDIVRRVATKHPTAVDVIMLFKKHDAQPNHSHGKIMFLDKWSMLLNELGLKLYDVIELSSDATRYHSYLQHGITFC